MCVASPGQKSDSKALNHFEMGRFSCRLIGDSAPGIQWEAGTDVLVNRLFLLLLRSSKIPDYPLLSSY